MSESNPAESVSTNDDNQPTRPRRGIRKKFLIGLGLLLTFALGFNAVQSWRASSQLESRLTKLREDGVPLTLDELQADRLAEENNAQTWIRRAKPHTEALDKLLRDYQGSEEFATFTPTAEQVELLEGAFAEHTEAFDFYAKAASCSGLQSDWRIGDQPSESLQTNMDESTAARSIMRHCAARAGLLMGQGDFDEALELGLQMLKLSRAVEHQPMVIGHMVGLACRSISLNVLVAVLERATLTDEQRGEIDQALAECESVESFRHALASERIYGLAAFRSEIFGGPLQSMVVWTFKFDACDYLDMIAQIDQGLVESRHAIVSRLDALAKKEAGPLTSLSKSALLQFRLSHDRMLTRVRCVRLLNALQRHYPDGIPIEPAVDKLRVSQKSIVDPFSGDPLKVVVTDEEVVVYSVAINGADDGGEFGNDKDQGIRIKRKSNRNENLSAESQVSSSQLQTYLRTGFSSEPSAFRRLSSSSGLPRLRFRGA